MQKTLLAALCAVSVAAGAPTASATVATLSATYDSALENTVFTISNTGALPETIRLLTSLGPVTSVNLPNLAAGGTEVYSFSQISGGFVSDPASAGLSDSTTYTLLVGLNNAAPAIASNVFSPLSNLTGGDVDFLGNNCNGFSGGPGNLSGTCGGTDALSGIVASVPEPGTLVLILPGIAVLGLVRRSRSSLRHHDQN